MRPSFPTQQACVRACNNEPMIRAQCIMSAEPPSVYAGRATSQAICCSHLRVPCGRRGSADTACKLDQTAITITVWYLFTQSRPGRAPPPTHCGPVQPLKLNSLSLSEQSSGRDIRNSSSCSTVKHSMLLLNALPQRHSRYLSKWQ